MPSPDANCTNRMLLWNPGGDVVLVPLPMRDSVRTKYAHLKRSGLGCYHDVQVASFEKRKAMLAIEFAHLVVRDGIDPQRLHAVLCELAEWRDLCADDMPGVAALR